MQIDLSGTPLRPAERRDWRQVADITAEGFAEDPVNRFVFGNRRAILSGMRVMTRDIYLKQGFSHLHGDAGSTLWLPPGVTSEFSTLTMLKFAIGQIRHGAKGALARGQALGTLMAKHHPKEPHLYLFAITTRETARGKGVGKTLLDPVLAHADRAGLPVYLENSNPVNTGFYRSRGFERTALFEVGEGGPVMEPMWREPSS
ncbi:MAG: GNAT family N-acetyltransferase [Pseudomonadota bacterium]